MQGASTGFNPQAPAQPVAWQPAGNNTAQTQAATQAAAAEQANKASNDATIRTIGIGAAILGGVAVVVMIIKAVFSTPSRRRR